MRYDAENDPAVFMARYKEIRTKFIPEIVKPVYIPRPEPAKKAAKTTKQKLKLPEAPEQITTPIINPEARIEVNIPSMPVSIPKTLMRLILSHYMLKEEDVMIEFTGPLGNVDPMKFIKKCVRWEIWTHLNSLGYSTSSMGRVSSVRKFDHTTVIYGKRKMAKLVENKEWTLWYGWRKQLFGLLSHSQSSTCRLEE